jgi:hypothetical protein
MPYLVCHVTAAISISSVCEYHGLWYRLRAWNELGPLRAVQLNWRGRKVSFSCLYISLFTDASGVAGFYMRGIRPFDPQLVPTRRKIASKTIFASITYLANVCNHFECIY